MQRSTKKRLGIAGGLLLFAALTVAAIGLTTGSGDDDARTQGSSKSSWVTSVTSAFRGPKTYELPAGTAVSVRLEHGVSTASNRSGDTFKATLTRPLTQGEHTLAPAGAEVIGLLTQVDRSGRDELSLKLTDIMLEGKEYGFESHALTITSEGSKKKDIGTIAGGAVVGALIGAVADGGKGAAIGSVIGGGGGATYTYFIKGDDVEFGPGQQFRFTLHESASLPEYGG